MTATMARLGEVMSARGANAEEAATQAYVYELAHAWMAGGITLDGVRSASTGKERFTAVRFAAPGEDKAALMLMIDALAGQDQRAVNTAHGHYTRQQLVDLQYVLMRQHDGVMAWTSPLHTLHGVPVYPDTTLPPGEAKRVDAEAKERVYREYMRQKREERR
ncbi:MAG: hypothetical protein E6Q97_19440 [Desulfurellales bacterium]|nr:MAG: hypothetical protein E6Q97_19440 [Desulfurellales bacterium]